MTGAGTVNQVQTRRGRTAIAVVDPDDTVRDVLMAHVGAFNGAATAYQDLDQVVRSFGPGESVVVLVGPTDVPDRLIPTVQELLAERPAVAVVMVLWELTSEVLQTAMRAGVDDVVPVTADDAEFADAVGRAASRLLGRRPTSVLPPPADADGGEHHDGKVITAFCTKGGVGRSVIAVNLAVALARRSPGRVVLVDADLQFGDVALMLRLQPVHSVAEAVAVGDRLDGALLSSLMLTHVESGLHVLAAPTDPIPADHIRRDDLIRVLSVLRSEYEYVVVDTSASFGEITLAAVQVADCLLAVAGLDVMSLKAAKVGLETMRVLGMPASIITFVLNRANTNVGLNTFDAERALELKVDVALPSDLVVAASVNKGVPVVIGSPKSKFAKGIGELATRFMTPVGVPVWS